MKHRKLVTTCKKRLPTICLVASAISGAAALYFTGKATVKAVRKYDELKASGVEITPNVILKQLVPYYIPAIGFGVTSLTCSIAGNTIHANRNRVLSLAATSAAETLRDFKEKSKEVIGEDKVKEVEQELAKETKLIPSQVALDSPIRVYDINNRIKFETTYKKLYDAESIINECLSNHPWTNGEVNLKKFYRYLGIEEKNVSNWTFSEKIWDADFIAEMWETNWISFRHEEVYDKDGTLMVMLSYCPEPLYQHEIETMYEEEYK